MKYVNIEKNSRATPEAELTWKAPGDFPDELDDALLKDLPAGVVQPVYIRVTVPRGTKPGLYRGSGKLDWDGGMGQEFSFAVRVSPVSFPERPRLKFVYWMSWDAPSRNLASTATPPTAGGCSRGWAS